MVDQPIFTKVRFLEHKRVLTKLCINIYILLFFVNVKHWEFRIEQVVFMVFCYKPAISIIHYIGVVKTKILATFITGLKNEILG